MKSSNLTFEEQLIGDVQKNKSTITCIRKMKASDGTGKASVYIDIRDYDVSGPARIPTKKGMTISLSNLNTVVGMLQAAGKECGTDDQL